MSTTTQRPALTKRQAAVLEYIKRFFKDNQTTPTVREIGEAFEIKSPNGVVCHLDQLILKGYLERAYGARGLVIVPDGCCPLCGRKE